MRRVIQDPSIGFREAHSKEQSRFHFLVYTHDDSEESGFAENMRPTATSIMSFLCFWDWSSQRENEPPFKYGLKAGKNILGSSVLTCH